MKAALAILFAVLVTSACAVRVTQYYLPTESKLAVEGTVCGSVPYGHARIPLGSELHASVSVIPSKERIGLSIQLPLPIGAKVRFLTPGLAVEDASSGRIYAGALAPFRVSVHGEGKRAGYVEEISPGSLLEGKGRNLNQTAPDTQYQKYDLHVSHATVGAAPSESIFLVFPPLEVNGALIEAQRIPLRLVEKTGVLACVQ